MKLVASLLFCLSITGHLLATQPQINVNEFRFLTSDSVELLVRIKGQGKPLVYMHGGPGSGSSWLEHFSGQMLEERFTVIYVDQRGVCRSGGNEHTDYSLDRLITDFEELRLHLGLKNWLIVGHSFGGILQMAYAQKYPDAVAGMLMINCTINLNETIASDIPHLIKQLQLTNTTWYYNEEVKPIERVFALFNQLQERNLFWTLTYEKEENYYLMEEVMSRITNWNYNFGSRAFYIDD